MTRTKLIEVYLWQKHASDEQAIKESVFIKIKRIYKNVHFPI